MSQESADDKGDNLWVELARKGQDLHLEGNLKEALKHFKGALEINSKVPELYYCVAQVLVDLKLWEEAGHFFNEAVKLKDGWVDALLMLGVCKEQTGEVVAAKKDYEAALKLDLESGAAHFNLACLLHGEKSYEDAVAHYLMAYNLHEQRDQCALAMAKIAHMRQKFLAAEKWYRVALEAGVMTDGDLSNFGVILQELGKYDESLKMCNEVLKHCPDHPESLYNRAFPYLLQGKYEDGWDAFEFRNTIVNREEVRWEGGDIKGKTLLIAFEQGAGDVIQCARYFPEIKKRVGTLVVECPKSLHRLLDQMGCVDRFIDIGQKVGTVDYQVPIFSLPKIFHTQVETIPSSFPYLEVGKMKKTQHEGFRLGIVWAGDPNHGRDAFRSCSLSDFGVAFKVDGVEWISLQKGARSNELKSFDFIKDWGSDCNDFYDTAERLWDLDLVISVDTSVVHLCGAMNRPVWALVQYAPDWRWFLEREDSPWYPSVKVIRQSHLGDWRGVMKRVKTELESLIESRV